MALIQERDGKYEGQLAQAVIWLAEPSLQQHGVKLLNELCESDKRPHAYYVLTRFYLRTGEHQKARTVIEKAFAKAETESFQERLALILMFTKTLALTNAAARALCLLQMQYTEQPHFNTLLYQYGKLIVTSPELHESFLDTGISALLEVEKVSV